MYDPAKLRRDVQGRVHDLSVVLKSRGHLTNSHAYERGIPRYILKTRVILINYYLCKLISTYTYTYT